MDDWTALKPLRLSLSKTLKDVSIDTGLDISTLSKLENGQISITKRTCSILNPYFHLKLLPYKAVVRYEEFDYKKSPQYKVLNEELKEKNIKLEKENVLLKAVINKISNIVIDCNNSSLNDYKISKSRKKLK